MGGMMNGFGGFGGFGLLGPILNLVLIIGLIGGLVWLGVRLWGQVNSGGQTAPTPYDQPSPREIVQARYARGEITREQYQQMLADLS